MSSPNFVLPQFLNLKINNMTTFPQDRHISFKKGINVIFGGNYSGKTTIINSLRYGVFGLSWGHTIEGLEKRYFTSRVREIDRKSLDIDVLYQIKPMTVNINRKVFSSGSAEIEARVSRGSQKSLSKSVTTINREKQYQDTLSKYMGLLARDQLKLIPSLIFADEDRQLIMWKKDLEDFVLSILTSSKSAARLQWIVSQISKAKNDLDKLQQEKDLTIRRQQDNKRNKKFLLNSLEKVKHIETDKHTRKYKKLSSELQKCKDKSVQINNALQARYVEQTDLLQQLNDNQKAIQDLKTKSEKLYTDLYKSIMNPDDPKELHFIRSLYHEKKCPFCGTDLSEEISLREKNKLCLGCGQGVLIEYKGNDKKIKAELLDLESKRKELIKSTNTIEINLTKIKEEIDNLVKSKEKKLVEESSLITEITKLKRIEERLHTKEVLSRELEELQKQISEIEKLITEFDKKIGAVNKEIDKLQQLYGKVRITMKTEIDLTSAKIRERFSRFISSATNGEVTGDLSSDYIPILNGRTIFYPESASQFERTIIDYAFRIALLSMFAEKTKTFPSLILETPDAVTDESYIPYLAKAIFDFSSNLSIIVTTVNTEMMEQLLNNYGSSEKKKRLVNLVTKGTLTQRKFYQAPLNSYLGG